MIFHSELERIRTGEASPKEARATIRLLLAGRDENAAAALYTALRAWTWSAMQTRRFDDDMEEWFLVLKGTGAALSRRDTVRAQWVEALSHLVEDSVRYAITHTLGQLLSRSHVGEALRTVQISNGRISRERLAEALGLTDSRLSQVLKDLTVAGALDREMEGKRASFTLTDTGRELLEKWVEAQRSQEKAQAEADAQARAQAKAEKKAEPLFFYTTVRIDKGVMEKRFVDRAFIDKGGAIAACKSKKVPHPPPYMKIHKGSFPAMHILPVEIFEESKPLKVGSKYGQEELFNPDNMPSLETLGAR